MAVIVVGTRVVIGRYRTIVGTAHRNTVFVRLGRARLGRRIG
jgi:hypothetical protein